MNEIVAGAGRLPDPLSERESRLLIQLEADIEANLKGFRKVGYALTVIRDKNLYRAEYDTFEDYCREVWDMGRPHAYRLIDSHLVVENLSTMGDKMSPMGDKNQIIEVLPANERQARPLASLSPEQQIEAWLMAIDTAKEKGGRVTAGMVDECVNLLRKKKTKQAVTRVRRDIENSDEVLPMEVIEAAQGLFDMVLNAGDEGWFEVGKLALIALFDDFLAALKTA